MEILRNSKHLSAIRAVAELIMIFYAGWCKMLVLSATSKQEKPLDILHLLGTSTNVG